MGGRPARAWLRWLFGHQLRSCCGLGDHNLHYAARLQWKEWSQSVVLSFMYSLRRRTIKVTLTAVLNLRTPSLSRPPTVQNLPSSCCPTKIHSKLSNLSFDLEAKAPDPAPKILTCKLPPILAGRRWKGQTVLQPRFS